MKYICFKNIIKIFLICYTCQVKTTLFFHVFHLIYSTWTIGLKFVKRIIFWLRMATMFNDYNDIQEFVFLSIWNNDVIRNHFTVWYQSKTLNIILHYKMNITSIGQLYWFISMPRLWPTVVKLSGWGRWPSPWFSIKMYTFKIWQFFIQWSQQN